MTRDEFIAVYIECCRANWPDLTWEKLQAEGVRCFPCDCDDESCRGWKMQFGMTNYEVEALVRAEEKA